MNCADMIFSDQVNICSGYTLSGYDLFEYWQTNDCPAAYSQAINTTGLNFIYNPDRQVCIQSKIVNLFNNYLSTNDITDNVTDPRYNNFQNTLVALCTDPTLPGVCAEFLGGSDTVNGYCDSFTRDYITNSSILRDFCGCYTPPDPVYLNYTLGSPECLIGASGCTAGCSPAGPTCVGNPSCDPLCHRALTSQKAHIPTGNIIGCPQTICVIDNVVVNAVNSSVPGGLNMVSLCSSCNKNSGCLCIVSSPNISVTASNIGLISNFGQFCGTGSVCLVEDADGQIISSSGCTGISIDNVPVNQYSSRVNLGIVLILLLITAVIFFVAISARFTKPDIQKPSILIEKK